MRGSSGRTRIGRLTMPVWLLLAATVAMISPARAGEFETIWRFSRFVDGDGPIDLTFDGTGALYGITESQGAGQAGTLFQLVKSKHKLNVLHSFQYALSSPLSVAFGSDGTIYGSTTSREKDAIGSVFSLHPATRVITTLATFVGCTPGVCGEYSTYPSVGFVEASTGVLYGSTQLGGDKNSGTLFKITLGASPQTSTLYQF